MTTQARLACVKPRSFLIDGSATFTIVMSRTIIRKPAHRINSANHLRSLVVSTGMSGLLAIRRGEVDMLVRPQRPEKSSVLSPPRLAGGGSGWGLTAHPFSL